MTKQQQTAAAMKVLTGPDRQAANALMSWLVKRLVALGASAREGR